MQWQTCETSDGKKLDIKGDIPTGGSVIIENGKVTIEYIKNESYCVIGNKEDLKIAKECYQLDTTASEQCCNSQWKWTSCCKRSRKCNNNRNDK